MVATRKVRQWSVRAMLSRTAAVVVMILCCTAGTSWAATFTVAVVHDGAWPGAADEVARLQTELVRHVPEDSEIRVIAGPGPAGEWSPVSVAAALDAALDDPEVNVVVVTGWLGKRRDASHCQNRW